MNIEALCEPIQGEDFSALCRLLRECVEAGASIGFVQPLAEADVEAYWRKTTSDLGSGNRLILVARTGPGLPILGSAQLSFETRANGRHRAEVQKVMVLPSHRRNGVAAALMLAVESSARGRSVRLLYLDTSDGAGGARKFYEALRYSYVGGIPGFALDPDGASVKNAIYYKALT